MRKRKNFGILCSKARLNFLTIVIIITGKTTENPLVNLVRRKLLLYSAKSHDIQCHGYTKELLFSVSVRQASEMFFIWQFAQNGLQRDGFPEILFGKHCSFFVNIFFQENVIFSYF